MQFEEIYSTSKAEEFMREPGKNRMEGIIAVEALKDGVPTEVTFYYADREALAIRGAFNIGYAGTGPRGLYNILIEAGFSTAQAEQVYLAKAYLSLKK